MKIRAAVLEQTGGSLVLELELEPPRGGMSVEGPDAKAAARLVARGDAISSPFHGGK